MPLINLIQEQRLTTRRLERKTRAFFLAFVATSVGSAGAFGLVSFAVENLRTEEARLNNQLRKNEPLVVKIEENAKEVGKLEPRLKTLEDAQLVTARWGRLLQHVSTQTPSETWLTALRAVGSDPAKPISISFVGVSTSQAAIGEFMQRLQNSADLENVNLKYSQEKLATNVRAVEFEIAADVAGTAEAIPTNEEEKK